MHLPDSVCECVRVYVCACIKTHINDRNFEIASSASAAVFGVSRYGINGCNYRLTVILDTEVIAIYPRVE